MSKETNPGHKKQFSHMNLRDMVIHDNETHFKILDHKLTCFYEHGERSGTVIFKEHDCNIKYILDYDVEDVSGTYEDAMCVFSLNDRETYDYTSDLVTVPEYHDTAGWEPADRYQEHFL